MKWFKHHCDAHRGQSIQQLMDKFGHTGLCYWILVEMCGEKLQQKASDRVSETDCVFTFHHRILRSNLRIGAVKLRAFLGECSAMALLSYEIKNNLVVISMPKLLEILDSDQKRPVQLREQNPPRVRIEEDKEEDKNIYTADFELAAGEFKKQFPTTVKGSKAESRFNEQMKDQDDFSNLLKAITNYAAHLSAPENKWRHPKQSFESFLGTKSSGFFWHSWIDMTAPKTNGMYDFLNDTKEGA